MASIVSPFSFPRLPEGQVQEMVVAADFVALWITLRKIALRVRIQIEWLQLVAGQRE